MHLSQCPVCSSKNFEQILEVKDHLVSRETFIICQCNDCLVRFTNPRPDENQLYRYYQSEDYVSHTNEGNNLVNNLYKFARYFTLRSKRRLIEKDTRQKRLLDVGCGTGHFLKHCTSKGWTVNGVEPDEGARTIARNEHGLSVVPTLEDIGEQVYDRITLWHVLEHLPDLSGTFERLSSLLNNDGKIFIAVPNYQAYEEKKFRDNWAAYDVPRHLYHFNRESLEILAGKNGLKVDKVYPMWLDSFYISLLSNKHKYQQNKFINSFINGSLSNIYGLKTGNFSSLIFKLSKIA